MRKNEPCCGTCKHFEPIPFAMVSLCENKSSDMYRCDCNPKEDVCFYYEPKDRREKQ